MQVIDLKPGDLRLGQRNEATGEVISWPLVDVFSNATDLSQTPSMHLLPGGAFVLVPFGADESQLTVTLDTPVPEAAIDEPATVNDLETIPAIDIAEPPADVPDEPQVDAVADELAKLADRPRKARR